MHLKLVNMISDPERNCKFKQRLDDPFCVEEISLLKFNMIMNTSKIQFVNFFSEIESDLLILAYDDSPLSNVFISDSYKYNGFPIEKTVFVIYASKEYLVQNKSLTEQCSQKLQKFYPKEEINRHLYLINADDDGELDAFINGIRNFRTKKIIIPEQELSFNEILRLLGKSFVDVQKEVALPDIDFWADRKFVHLTKRCAICDTSAMMELGNYYAQQENDEFCRLASNYWYYTAFLYGNKEAKLWLDNWIFENSGERIPMPILPNKIYKTYDIWIHDYEHYYRGAMLKALGFDFFSEERDYEIFRFFEPGLVQIKSWCNTADPDEDGFGMSEEYDWWFLDEFFDELPGVKMLHSYSCHDRLYGCTETFDKQYECAKKVVENKRLFFQERNNNL